MAAARRGEPIEVISHGAQVNINQHLALGNRTGDLDLHFALHPSQGSQMCRKHHAYHGSVCTSTESTAGKSRTIGAQLSPASEEAYTCPPVVPK